MVTLSRKLAVFLYPEHCCIATDKKTVSIIEFVPWAQSSCHPHETSAANPHAPPLPTVTRHPRGGCRAAARTWPVRARTRLTHTVFRPSAPRDCYLPRLCGLVVHGTRPRLAAPRAGARWPVDDFDHIPPSPTRTPKPVIGFGAVDQPLASGLSCPTPPQLDPSLRLRSPAHHVSYVLLLLLQRYCDAGVFRANHQAAVHAYLVLVRQHMLPAPVVSWRAFCSFPFLPHGVPFLWSLWLTPFVCPCVWL